MIVIIACLCLIICCAPKPGDPERRLSNEERANFEEGKKVFERKFTEKDGLGPIFNATSCAECHEDPVSGGVGDEVETHVSARAEDRSCDLLVAQGGPVIQGEVTPIAVAHGVAKEQAPLGAGTGQRTTPPLFGLGLLDAVPDAYLLKLADPEDKDNDGVSGRVARLADGRIGRFGRKAQIATLHEFVATAFQQEQGITSPDLLSELEPQGKPLPAGADPAPDPELRGIDLELAEDFVRFLAPVEPLYLRCENESRGPDGTEHSRMGPEPDPACAGRRIFYQVGCAACHVACLPVHDRRQHASQVCAYTDLLLHDMGPELADICMGAASETEFRTAPLMGLRLEHQFMHDGRAKTIPAAIEAHGGEATSAKLKFKAIFERSREALLKFLGTL